MYKIVIGIPFYKREHLTSLCFTWVNMLAEQIMAEMSDVEVRLLACGSEEQKSKDFAMKFVHDENYYIECPQTVNKKIPPRKLLLHNVHLKYNATIGAIKNLPHDLVFIFGSDDFINKDFFIQSIKIARENNENNNKENPNPELAFCNGMFNSTTRLGGIRIIEYATNNSFILTKVNNSDKVTKVYKGYTSFSMGAFGFTRATLEKVGYALGSSEIIFEQTLFEAGITKHIIPQIYYDVKDIQSVSLYSAYAKHVINIIQMTPDEKKEYLTFIKTVQQRLDSNNNNQTNI